MCIMRLTWHITLTSVSQYTSAVKYMMYCTLAVQCTLMCADLSNCSLHRRPEKTHEHNCFQRGATRGSPETETRRHAVLGSSFSPAHTGCPRKNTLIKFSAPLLSWDETKFEKFENTHEWLPRILWAGEWGQSVRHIAMIACSAALIPWEQRQKIL